MELNELAKALAAAQAAMRGAKKDKKNPFFKSTYADLSSVFDAIREPFAEHGLSVTQPLKVLDNGRTLLRTLLLHTSGQSIESTMLLPDIADPQKLGSAITYYRRYQLMAIAGIAAEDDDGNEAASGAQKQRFSIGEEKGRQLRDKLAKHPELLANVERLLETNGQTFADLTSEEANKIWKDIPSE